MLAKIYKNNENQNDDDNGADQVENMMNPEELMEKQNQLQDEPSPRRIRLSVNQESNYYSGANLPMVAPARFMCDSDQQLAIQPMDTLNGSNLIQSTFQDLSQGIAMEQVQPSYGSSSCEYHHNQRMSTSTNDFRFSSDAPCSYSTVLNSIASTNVLQQAYNSYQDLEQPQDTLQSFLDQPMELTEDDLKEIIENLDKDNMSFQSSANVLQQAYDSYQDTEQPRATLQSFPDQPIEWTEDDLDKEIMGSLDEDDLSS